MNREISMSANLARVLPDLADLSIFPRIPRKCCLPVTFMAKAKIAIENGGIRIVEEGKGKKFLKEVEQVTFSGKYAAKGNQEILCITERCVFRLKP